MQITVLVNKSQTHYICVYNTQYLTHLLCFSVLTWHVVTVNAGCFNSRPVFSRVNIYVLHWRAVCTGVNRRAQGLSLASWKSTPLLKLNWIICYTCSVFILQSVVSMSCFFALMCWTQCDFCLLYFFNFPLFCFSFLILFSVSSVQYHFACRQCHHCSLSAAGFLYFWNQKLFPQNTLYVKITWEVTHLLAKHTYIT